MGGSISHGTGSLVLRLTLCYLYICSETSELYFWKVPYRGIEILDGGKGSFRLKEHFSGLDLREGELKGLRGISPTPLKF